MNEYLDIMFKNNLLKKNTINYKEYKYTFNEFILFLEKDKLLNPIYQNDINLDKINEMVFSYKNNPEFFNFKNKIVLAFIEKTNNMYIMDGQHRIELIKILTKENYNDNIYICCYIIEDESKLRLLYEELNKDSYKNYNYVLMDDFSKDIYNKFVEYLDKNYKLYFEKKEKKEAYRKTKSEFLNELIEKQYILKFNNHNDLIKDIETARFNFDWLIKYKDLFNNNEKIFYKDEHDSVSNGIVFTLKNNNFIEYLLDRNIKPYHKLKKEKKRISQKLKRQVWEKEFGKITNGKCPYKNCKNIIYHNDYSCGHIISEYNGGDTIIENLRPMCYGCNNKLGKRDWK